MDVISDFKQLKSLYLDFIDNTINATFIGQFRQLTDLSIFGTNLQSWDMWAFEELQFLSYLTIRFTNYIDIPEYAFFIKYINSSVLTIYLLFNDDTFSS